MGAIALTYQKYGFLFSELVKRDFKKKYKRTVLGIFWSMLGPLLQLLVLALVFTQFFGRYVEHFIIYLFAGKLVFLYFKEATVSGMLSLTANAGIITKINVPKHIFLLSRNVSSLLNFGITLLLFFLFVAIDGVAFHPRFIMLLFPMVCLLVFNIGAGLVLSALHVFFKDMQYIYEIVTMLVMYLSAIFYTIDVFPVAIQRLFILNPIFTYIHYFRLIVLGGVIPTPAFHLVCAFYAIAALGVGIWLYKRLNHRFIFNL